MVRFLSMFRHKAFGTHSRSGMTVVLAAAFHLAAPCGFARSEDFRFYIREYRVSGSTKLSSLEIQEIVYPYLGPARTADDVEQARNALEAAFKAKGYQTVAVLIPQQDPRHGLIRLEVVEGKVGRLRVNDANYFLPSRIKKDAPSLAEGNIPDFNRVQKEILALNRSADRRVVPSLRPGVEPGTVDVDLNVEDKLPLHGSLELNNRYSADTTRLRLNGSLSYGNLFQLGHTLGGSFQIAPLDIDDAQVYSAYYLARAGENLSLMAQASFNDSDISTLGGTNVVGRGNTFGLRAIIDLPPQGNFHHSLSLGIDRKDLDEETFIFDQAVTVLSSPITYYPLSASYSATHVGEDHFTEANLSVTLHLRGLGSDWEEFNEKRYGARGSFIYLRGDTSHTRDLQSGAQLYAKLQGQLASGPLINSEQYSGGGLGNARGYLESSALGDNGLFGTLEFRSPSLIGVKDEQGRFDHEWRFHAFLDTGVLGIHDALPGQDSTSTFASIGLGTRFNLANHYHGSIDLALPLLEQGRTRKNDPSITFRGWADF